jgi:hypothetical protein
MLHELDVFSRGVDTERLALKTFTGRRRKTYTIDAHFLIFKNPYLVIFMNLV